MRAGFGLLSLLLAAAIIFYVSFGGKNGGVDGAALKENQELREQGTQIAGQDQNGVPVSESIKLDEVDVDGHLRRLKVVSVVPGGPFATAYGLQPNDEITEIGGLDVGMNDDGGLAKTLVYGAYQENKPLTIVRAGEKKEITPNTPMSHFHAEDFGKPNVPAIPTH